MKSRYKRSFESFDTRQFVTRPAIMKILLLLSFVALSLGHPALLEKVLDTDSVPQESVSSQISGYADAVGDEKKVDKRSYGWGGWSLPIHTVGWPWYGGHGWGSGIGLGGWGGIGHGWLGGGWGHGWPLIIPSYGHGWHSKW